MTTQTTPTYVDRCLEGAELYGDTFTPEQIQSWYADEKEAYANLYGGTRESYDYEYHAFNRIHGFSGLPAGRLGSVLGMGAAYGDELLPIIDRVDRVAVLEPSDKFESASVGGKPIEWHKPAVDGTMPFADGTFDLITCFGVLHHIPNVSFVLAEMGRVTRSGGYALVREPITSMGDWRRPRAGLTPHERGLPIRLFESMISRAGFQVVRKRYCMMGPLQKVLQRVVRRPFNSGILTRLDRLACAMTAWNGRYHATTHLERIRPASAYFVLKKS
jgi:SAM-dependent methyltransferase